MHILVLGGYGLIGEAIVERLSQGGHEVSGLGRDVVQARRRRPDITWVRADLAALRSADDWAAVLSGVDAVVNAAGALQDGLRDDVRAVHETAILALIAACEAEGVKRFVQISAVGADRAAADPFFRTKAVADAALAASSLEWVIFRPGLVIGRAAYGSTAMLRALAAFPYVQPLVLADRPIQTVAASDVADAVLAAINGKLPSGTSVDLVEDDSHSVAETVRAFRARLGLPPAPVLALPLVLSRPLSLIADALGWLGWRSPLRSTAMRAIAAGVTGDPEPYRAFAAAHVMPLERTLAALPSNVQEVWFARLWLLKPVILGVLALFFLVSGVIGLMRFDAAMFVLTSRSMPQDVAYLAVLAGSLADIALGVLLLVRRTARMALLGMIVLTLGYLAAASLFAPGLWSDPLGSLVKTVPIMVLCLVGLAVLDER